MPEDKATIGLQGNKKEFRGKITEQREHNRKTEWISNMEKELQGLEQRHKAKKYTSIQSEQHSKKKQFGKSLAMILYVDSDSKNSLPSTTDLLSKWTERKKNRHARKND